MFIMINVFDIEFFLEYNLLVKCFCTVFTYFQHVYQDGIRKKKLIKSSCKFYLTTHKYILT